MTTAPLTWQSWTGPYSPSPMRKYFIGGKIVAPLPCDVVGVAVLADAGSRPGEGAPRKPEPEEYRHPDELSYPIANHVPSDSPPLVVPEVGSAQLNVDCRCAGPAFSLTVPSLLKTYVIGPV